MDQRWLMVGEFHWICQMQKGKESIFKGYVYTIVLHIVFEVYGKESKVNVYGNEISIQLFYTLYLNRKEKNAK